MLFRSCPAAQKRLHQSAQHAVPFRATRQQKGGGDRSGRHRLEGDFGWGEKKGYRILIPLASNISRLIAASADRLIQPKRFFLASSPLLCSSFTMIELPKILQCKKYVAPFPGWVRDGREVSIVSSLESEGITLPFCRLRICAVRTMPDEAVTVQIEHARGGQKYRPLVRLDWRPINDTHRNKHRGPPEYRWKEIVGTHYHRFDLNYFESEKRMLEGNLPIAVPVIPEPMTFAEILDFVGKEFNILGLELYEPPPWEGVLL